MLIAALKFENVLTQVIIGEGQFNFARVYTCLEAIHLLFTKPQICFAFIQRSLAQGKM